VLYPAFKVNEVHPGVAQQKAAQAAALVHEELIG
jgi:hypothetical protein